MVYLFWFSHPANVTMLESASAPRDSGPQTVDTCLNYPLSETRVLVVRTDQRLYHLGQAHNLTDLVDRISNFQKYIPYGHFT